MHHLAQVERAHVAVVAPFRLDFTVAALQRVPSNPVEVWTCDGRYLRAWDGASGPVVWEVSQDPNRPSLRLRLHGAAREPGPWRALLRHMLGCDVDLTGFYALAAQTPVLARLAERFRGLKPPRFATLWESLVNTIAFQQLSLPSGMASVRRLVEQCSRPIAFEDLRLYPFPTPRAVARLSDAGLRACGFSTAKGRSLRAAADAIRRGALRDEDLEALPDAEAASRLVELPRIGPWTASLILLRGMRRLSSFPSGDSGANRRFRAVFGATDPARLLEQLDGWRGMLYYHLLLSSRADAAG